MNIDWGIIERGIDRQNALMRQTQDDIWQSFERGQMGRAVNALMQNPSDTASIGRLARINPQAAMQLHGWAREREQQDAARRIGAQASGGDIRGATAAALQAGNFDLAAKLGEMSRDQATAARDRFRAIAPLAMQARRLPYEQRRAFIQQNAPRLQELGGLTPDALAQYDPTNEALDGLIASGQTVEEFLSANDGGRTEIDGVVYDRAGNPIFESAYPRIIPGSEGSFYTQPRIGFGPGRSAPQQQPQQLPPLEPLPPGATAESLRREAAEAIAAGGNPAAIAADLAADLQQLQGGAGPSNVPQTFPGDFDGGRSGQPGSGIW